VHFVATISFETLHPFLKKKINITGEIVPEEFEKRPAFKDMI